MIGHDEFQGHDLHRLASLSREMRLLGLVLYLAGGLQAALGFHVSSLALATGDSGIRVVLLLTTIVTGYGAMLMGTLCSRAARGFAQSVQVSDCAWRGLFRALAEQERNARRSVMVLAGIVLMFAAAVGLVVREQGPALMSFLSQM